MKSQISSVDLHYLVKEMQFLAGGKIDKIYHPKKEELLLQFHITGKGKAILRIISGKFIFLSDYKESYEQPSGFCMFLRKHLNNARLREISQAGSERIIRLVFETKERKLILYIELFGKGNIVLTDEKNIIINALEQKKWSDREIKKGLEYKFPQKEFDIFKIKNNELKQILDSDKKLIYKLAKDLGLGGTYSEEICANIKTEKSKEKLSQEDIKKISGELKRITYGKIKPKIIYENDKIKDIIPFDLKIYDRFKKKEFSSFNAAFDHFFREEYGKDEFISKHQNIIDKTKKIIEQQLKQVKELERKAKENNRKGELIYENYKLVEEILKEINKAREKYSFEEIKKKLKGHKVIKEVDGKNKIIRIEV